jgi:hypothetical protein
MRCMVFSCRLNASPRWSTWISSPRRYLYQSTSPAVQDYLCNRLHDLPEEALEKYLLQLVYIAVERPSSTLEQTIIELCSKSFRIAVKVGLHAQYSTKQCAT